MLAKSFALLSLCASITSAQPVVVGFSTGQTLLSDGGMAGNNVMPLQLCKTSALAQWLNRNHPSISNNYGDDATIVVNDQSYGFNSLMLQMGFALPLAGIDEETEHAIVERRGEWACAKSDYIFKIAKKSDIDARILHTVALNESGLNGKPWPWTINYAGRGYYFRSKLEAVSAAKFLLANGRNNFDIGLTQTSWKYNGYRYSSVEEGFRPSSNIRVAETILLEHFAKRGNWAMAIADYHNGRDQKRRTQYLNNFVRNLKVLEREST
jgi:Transglycosylase SLT domain